MMRWTSYMLLLVLALSVVMPGLTIAQEPDQKVVKPKEPKHIYLKLLHGKQLLNDAGEVIGPVDEVIIDLSRFKIQFAVVATGGFLGIGDRFTAIPFSLLKWRMNEETEEPDLIANITRGQIERAPAFDYAQLNLHLADENWRRQTREAFGVYPEEAILPAVNLRDERIVADSSEAEDEKKSPNRFRRSKDLQSFRILVKKADAELPKIIDGKAEICEVTHKTAGTVRDFIVNWEETALTVLVLELPREQELTPRRLIVPTSALEPLKSPDEFCIGGRIPLDLEAAPYLKKDALVELEDEKSCRTIKSFYGSESKL